MTCKLHQYQINNGEHIVQVDRQRKVIIIDEMGGWSRQYTMGFDHMIKSAQAWDLPLDMNSDDATLAKIATQLMLANHAAEHSLDPFRYVPRSKKITHPKDRESIKNFDLLIKQYGAREIIDNLSVESKKMLLQEIQQSIDL